MSRDVGAVWWGQDVPRYKGEGLAAVESVVLHRGFRAPTLSTVLLSHVFIFFRFFLFGLLFLTLCGCWVWWWQDVRGAESEGLGTVESVVPQHGLGV